MINKNKVLYGTNILGGFGIGGEEQLGIIAETGFSAFFSGRSREKRGEPVRLAEAGARSGLVYEMVHAPFGRINSMWVEGVEGDEWREMLMMCVDDAAAAGAGIVVLHATVAAVAPAPSEIGYARFRAVAERAAQKGVKIAIENLEIPEHVEFLFDRLSDLESVGFCWDTGHNLCYTPDIDMMKLYGDRLICLHINDNNGMRNPGVVTWHDDAHFMPFDGRVDWQAVADRLDDAGWQGIMTQEMSRGKEGCEKIGRYLELSYREYLSQTLERLKRIDGLRSKI